MKTKRTMFTCFIFALALTLCGYAEPKLKKTYEDENHKLWILHFGFEHKGVATLFVFPNGDTMLFDTGDNAGDGERIINVLKNINEINGRKPKNLDFLVLSHYHKDHAGNKKLLSGQLNIGRIYDYSNIVSTLGRKITDLGGASVRPIAAKGKVAYKTKSGFEIKTHSTKYPNPRYQHLDDENAKSVALLVEYKKFSYFIGGDLTGGKEMMNEEHKDKGNTPDMEKYVAASIRSWLGDELDVINVNHHGSQTSSNDTFLDAVFPASAKTRNFIVMVNQGYKNLLDTSILQDISSRYGKNKRGHIWQTRKGGKQENRTIENLEDRIDRLLVAKGDIWLSSNGSLYTITAPNRDGHSHQYSAD